MKKIFTLILVFSIYSTFLLAQTPNAGFETWVHTGSYDNPTSWDSPNSQTATVFTYECYKVSAAAHVHSGTYAVELVTQNVLGLGMAPGVVTTGTLPTSSTGNITGGVAYTLRPDSISGWYQYTPVAGDNGFFAFALLGSGGNTDTIGSAFFKTPATTVANYTRFSAHIVYKSANPVVNSVWVVCSSATGAPTSANTGSTLYADDLNVVFNPASGIAAQNNPNELIVYPNPSTGNFTIKNENLKIKNVEVYNVMGEKVYQSQISNLQSQITLDAPNGLYFYSVMDENNSVIKTGKLIIQK